MEYKLWAIYLYPHNKDEYISSLWVDYLDAKKEAELILKKTIHSDYGFDETDGVGVELKQVTINNRFLEKNNERN